MANSWILLVLHDHLFRLRSTDYHSYRYLYPGTVYFYSIARISEDFH
jgi:hypothetical protein